MSRFAIMSVSTVNQTDCDAIKKLTDAGLQVVVVQDENFEKTIELFKKLQNERADTTEA